MSKFKEPLIKSARRIGEQIFPPAQEPMLCIGSKRVGKYAAETRTAIYSELPWQTNFNLYHEQNTTITLLFLSGSIEFPPPFAR